MRRELLNAGYIQVIDTWGSDERIIESARMSTNKGFLGWGPFVTDEPCSRCKGAGETDDRGYAIGDQPYFSKDTCRDCGGDGKLRKPGDEKLLRFLWEKKHSTPFEFCGLTIEVQAPIFVFREWHRHRVPFGYNELSARYTPLPDVNYVPTLERCMIGSDGKNKQASTIRDAAELTDAAALDWLDRLERFYVLAEELYQHGLNIGLPKELARIVVPVGRYSRMRATGNLRGWVAFMGLRCASDAQWEIRQFANVIAEIVSVKFPRTYELLAPSLGKPL